MKTWHKIAIALVVPTVLVVGFVAYKKFIKKESVFGKKQINNDQQNNKSTTNTTEQNPSN